jgi:hypothetical protein
MSLTFQPNKENETMETPTLTELNPAGFDLTVDVVADGAGRIIERHVSVTGKVLSPVMLRADLVDYIEKLAKGEEITALNG